MDCREHQKFHVDGYQVGIPMRGLQRPYAILSRLYEHNVSLDWGHPRSNCVPTAQGFMPQFSRETASRVGIVGQKHCSP